MNFKYKLFAYIFNFFKVFSFKKEDVSFIMDKRDSFYGNLEYIKDEFDKRGDFNFNYLSKEEYSFDGSFMSKILGIFSILNFFLVKSYKLSKSKYIFLNDNFFPLAYMNSDENTIIVQLWHATGAFKRFGFAVIDDDNIKDLIKLSGANTDYVAVSSKNISKDYEEAFAVESNQILSLGVPKADCYFNEDFNNKKNISKIRKSFEDTYPEIRGKKIVIYAPTFRENPDLNRDISNNFDFELFNKELGEDYVIFFRYHPKFQVFEDNNESSSNRDESSSNHYENYINVSNYPNINELLLISDALITDYSSIMVEFVLLSKPIIFYPYDLDYYITNERGFYFDYENVPGLIAKDTNDIVKTIKDSNFNEESNFDIKKISSFVNDNFDYLDDKSSKRIVDFLLSEK